MADTLDSILWRAAQDLADEVDALSFAPPVTHVYNPLRYAGRAHREYLRRYAATPKQVLFLGMNPGPFGMAQTGVPFGDVVLVRDWLGISTDVGKPENEHPRRPVEGFAFGGREQSGKRLWGAFAERHATPEAFFRERFVANYCPLVFMEEGGRNRTPDALPRAERDALFEACDRHLQAVCTALAPRWVIGVGGFAHGRAERALAGTGIEVGRILHPSPASPAANRGWAEQAHAELERYGLAL